MNRRGELEALAHARVLREVSRELREPAARRIAQRLREAETSSQREAELLLEAAGDFEGLADYLELEKKRARLEKKSA